MSFQPCENSDRQSFEAIVGAENVLSSAAEREKYSRDMTEDLTYLPELVLRPRNTGEVAE
jgi:glycolate oxidase